MKRRICRRSMFCPPIVSPRKRCCNWVPAYQCEDVTLRNAFRKSLRAARYRGYRSDASEQWATSFPRGTWRTRAALAAGLVDSHLQFARCRAGRCLHSGAGPGQADSVRFVRLALFCVKMHGIGPSSATFPPNLDPSHGVNPRSWQVPPKSIRQSKSAHLWPFLSKVRRRFPEPTRDAL